ncbi:MAG: tyrosine-type recombinase/integrase [Mycobacterium sp.]
MHHPLVEEWALWQRAGRRAARTVEERCRVIRTFLLEAGIEPLSAKAMDIARWLSAHEEWGQSTAATYYSYLMSWHKWLVMMDYRSENPMHKLQTPRRPERSPRPLADAELLALLTLNMHRRTYVMILLGALAGLRVAEIAKVRGEDIDRSANRIQVTGKGSKRAWVPLHPILAQVAESMPVRGWWFPGNCRRPGQPIRSKSVSDIIGQAMRRGGIAGTPHALRHWYATTLLSDGADLRTVQELMRHSSVQTTQVYTQVPDARRNDAVGRLDPFRAA